ncbi:endonuclease-8 [Streptoalloteichus tenebrarius]|uniref:DNA-(apurinic or apyrimidinic site) lyase n=1 Tax=Streptoalloteichus tenebrarius (strain ATCC 17920 / DSM 40477 / JCM 4838 / CBS 697.72 / NBRC 16177 / NCIMB 11028 / NRRL B-12390 / A12253. 1 / ISP 5477) TaxID=1933 RepID=A0ABT1HN52_STRSD|nr:DNA-formamidopyrimidine glycosylase family protein [Streptoalloteichus tenebrarius]MCP2256945.1 endonuclease-8 [Streptoalloteichus tenebrarius]BFF00143.1 Fpg/Nei family DNA glycosylase [Streptoalloteichus tenebrarius]
MPEGDTVYLAGRRLHAALARQRLTRGELRHPRLSSVDLAGRVVLGVHSVGKHLLFRFDDGTTLHTHFRLDGAWHLYRPEERWRGPTHQVRAVLANEHRVAVGFRLHDMALVPTSDECRLVGHLGPDLLDPAWGRQQEDEAVERLLRDPDREIGLALLDQTAVAGLGNLYKTEVCFLLGVTPWTPVSDVDVRSAVRWSRKLLLRNAARPEQSTTGELGRDAQHWVFERTGRPCRRCGAPVRSAEQGSGLRERVAYFCPTCQHGPRP